MSFINPQTTLTVAATKSKQLATLAQLCTVEELNQLVWLANNPTIKKIAIAKLKEFQ